ncbi:DUF411 domain-containing protein [Candidatus Woesearchaeota archaeon]|nr:DUF411 domain-containing protein [Candidatus Woesearchaeota archaeon]
MKTNKLFFMFLVVALIAVSGCASSQNSQNAKASNFGIKATIFKSSGCGCCNVYLQYMNKKGFNLEVMQTEDMDAVKAKYNIPASMQSCHTIIIGDYFVEGHVPSEAIEKLMAEKPTIRGIAMPGMPSGSPGMPGSKKAPFVIYAINKDGSTAEFMRI